MAETEVYYTNVEVTFAEGTEHHGKLAGGFVYAFVRAHDVREALPPILEELEACGLEVLEVEFLAPYRDVPWESDEDQQLYDGLAAEAAASADVILDDIEAFETRED